MMPNGSRLVLIVNPEDSVKSVHDYIETLTNIPPTEQRLIHQGEQLQWEQSLLESSVQNNSVLQLFVRNRSTYLLEAWQMGCDLRLFIFDLYKGNATLSSELVNSMLLGFLTKIKDYNGTSVRYLQVFFSLGFTKAIVMLYLSDRPNTEFFSEFIGNIIYICHEGYDNPKSPPHIIYALILFELFKTLRLALHSNHYVNVKWIISNYGVCRNALCSNLKYVQLTWDSKDDNTCWIEDNCQIFFEDIFSFFQDDITMLLNSLSSEIVPPISSSFDQLDEVCYLGDLCVPLQSVIMQQLGLGPLVSLSSAEIELDDRLKCHFKEIKFIYDVCIDLLEKIDVHLEKIENLLSIKSKRELNNFDLPGFYYFSTLKIIHCLSKVYSGASEMFHRKLKERKIALNYLLMYKTKTKEIVAWISEYDDVIDFKSRRKLVRNMFPKLTHVVDDDDGDFVDDDVVMDDVVVDDGNLNTIIIERSKLLEESFNSFSLTSSVVLKSNFSIKFKNEVAHGPGVVREWLFLVCQDIFNPSSNDLFVACPSDLRRVYPNPASKVKSYSRLKYYKFAGNVIGLALQHKIQVGIVFDRVFVNLLAGKTTSLEDIQDADPQFYSSCKKIIEMSADEVDSDVLGLTFVHEFEDEFGSRKVVELCPGGQNVAVNSRNRKQFVDLLIQHVFATSIAQQVARFSDGFSNILLDWEHRQLFFDSLELKNLDKLLLGKGNAISVRDWKIHTLYQVYKKTDPQIVWFWKIVQNMTLEQRRHLMFFWTSVKYLPIDGFCGLERLWIERSFESEDHLPSSHTCFYKLFLPPYSSMDIMKDRLHTIAQEHISNSYGMG
ncbi:E3 ubiquitin-protein ligase UPL5-like [Impatiens glandulifera]|uniref:E3 ubiquitin-protein ligase UPL5-like n=1 Tax=Impatiens glandulifera TaxID=253017 RepID=UPI001FB08336|nr:E3 ubiquitin-protein ligase UPL5-like [Impatiens glandulifera]